MTIIVSATLPAGSRDIHQKPSIFWQLIFLISKKVVPPRRLRTQGILLFADREAKKIICFSKIGCPPTLIN